MLGFVVMLRFGFEMVGLGKFGVIGCRYGGKVFVRFVIIEVWNMRVYKVWRGGWW